MSWSLNPISCRSKFVTYIILSKSQEIHDWREFAIMSQPGLGISFHDQKEIAHPETGLTYTNLIPARIPVPADQTGYMLVISSAFIFIVKIHDGLPDYLS